MTVVVLVVATVAVLLMTVITKPFYKTNYVPDTILSTLHILIHLIIISTLHGSFYLYYHF